MRAKQRTLHVRRDAQTDSILTLLKMVPAATRSDSTEEPHSLREYNKHLSVRKPQFTLKIKYRMNIERMLHQGNQRMKSRKHFTSNLLNFRLHCSPPPLTHRSIQLARPVYNFVSSRLRQNCRSSLLQAELAFALPPNTSPPISRSSPTCHETDAHFHCEYRKP